MQIDQDRFRCGRCSEGHYQLGSSCLPCGSDALVRFLARGVPIIAVVFGTAILYIACKFSPPSGFLCGKAFVAETCWKLLASPPILDCLLPNAALSNTRLLSIVPLIDTVGHAALSKCIVAVSSMHHLVCELRIPNADSPAGPADGNLGVCRLAVPWNT